MSHRRRTDVVGVFPNLDATIRLIGADEWTDARCYIGLEILTACKTPAIKETYDNALTIGY